MLRAIRTSWVALGFLSILLLVSCHRNKPSPYTDSADLTGLPARASSAGDDETNALMRRLQRRGVKVITLGQDYLISIPANLLFADQSPRIKWGSYAVLNDVVCYLKQFNEIAIDVAAFSTKYVSPARERALTYARARAVAGYLWSQNIDSRFVFIRGLGSDRPIIASPAGGDYSLNARVEITFRNAVA